MPFYRLRKIWKPEIFQGHGKRGDYFEGWYYKCISRDETAGFAVIPGFSLGEKDRHGFIHVFDGKNERYWYHRYDLSETSYSTSRFDIRIGSSRFTGKYMDLRIENARQSVSGRLAFSPIDPWPVTLFSVGAMGWYAFVPGMEDYHGVLSFNHRIEGTLRLDGDSIDFSGGRGYMEKDWGRSFPQSWVWAQSNNFSDPDLSAVISIAKIPWMGSWFTGFIIGVWFHRELYSFSTFSGGKVTDFFRIGSDGIGLAVRTKRYSLSAEARKIGGHRLNAPVAGEMSGHVHESLQSELFLTLKDRARGEVMFSGKGTSAGVEIHGDIEELAEDLGVIRSGGG